MAAAAWPLPATPTLLLTRLQPLTSTCLKNSHLTTKLAKMSNLGRFEGDLWKAAMTRRKDYWYVAPVLLFFVALLMGPSLRIPPILYHRSSRRALLLETPYQLHPTTSMHQFWNRRGVGEPWAGLRGLASAIDASLGHTFRLSVSSLLIRFPFVDRALSQRLTASYPY